MPRLSDANLWLSSAKHDPSDERMDRKHTKNRKSSTDRTRIRDPEKKSVFDEYDDRRASLDDISYAKINAFGRVRKQLLRSASLARR